MDNSLAPFSDSQVWDGDELRGLADHLDDLDDKLRGHWIVGLDISYEDEATGHNVDISIVQRESDGRLGVTLR